VTRYRFKFDSTGASIAVSPPAPVHAAAPAAVLPVPAPAAAAPAAALPSAKAERIDEGLPSAQESIALIDELARSLEEDGNLPLDMALLEDREVLLTPPHWTFVADTARRAVGRNANVAQGAVVLDDHIQNLRKYAGMLQAREQILDRILSLVAVASGASLSTEPIEQVRDAIRALPKGESDWGRLLDMKPSLPVSLRSGRVKDWTEAVRARHDEVRSRKNQFDWHQVEERGWDTWRKRLQQYRRGRPKFDVDQADVLLRTRGVGPAIFFRNDLGAMTLKEWSDALIAGLHREQTHSQVLIPAWVSEEARQELFDERKTLLIVIGRPEHSSAAGWLPSKRYGCFWISQSDSSSISRLPDTLADLRVPLTVIRVFVTVEVAGEGEQLAKAVHRSSDYERVALSVWERLRATFGPSLPEYEAPRHLAYLGAGKLPPGVTPSLAYLENPKGVDAVVQRLEALMRPPAS
jgi:hypothetical protein